MRENTVAKVIKVLGILGAIGGVFLGIPMLGDYDEFTSYMGWFLLFSGIIVCIIFFGFAEIIDLLQKNWNTQEDILKTLKNNNSKMSYMDNTSSNTIQDIESHLPKM